MTPRDGLRELVSDHAVSKLCCVSNSCPQHATRRGLASVRQFPFPQNLTEQVRGLPAVSRHNWPDTRQTAPPARQKNSRSSHWQRETSASGSRGQNA